jgi:hypothetical protein
MSRPMAAHFAKIAEKHSKVPRAHLLGAWNSADEGDPGQYGGDCDARGRVRARCTHGQLVSQQGDINRNARVLLVVLIGITVGGLIVLALEGRGSVGGGRGGVHVVPHEAPVLFPHSIDFADMRKSGTAHKAMHEAILRGFM